jgi:cysteine desulfurase
MKPLFFDPALTSSFDEKSYLQLREKLGLDPKDALYFAQGGADAVSKVLQAAYMQVARETGRNHFIMPAIEGSHWLSCFRDLHLLDCTTKILSVNEQGQITKEALDESIKPRTALVSLSWANGLTGVVQPIWELAQLCRERNVLIHVDASEVIGKIDFKFKDFEIDFLTFDGKSMGAPEFSGGIVVKAGLEFHPFGFDTGMGQWDHLNAAYDQLSERFDHLCTETARLRGKLEKEIKKAFPDAVIFFEKSERLPNSCAIGIPGAAGNSLQFLLQRQGIYVSTGGGRFLALPKLLTASGSDPLMANCAVALQLAYESTEEDIDRLVDVICSSVMHLRKISNKWMESAV